MGALLVPSRTVDAVGSPSRNGRPYERPMDRVAAISDRGYNRTWAFQPRPALRIRTPARKSRGVMPFSRRNMRLKFEMF